MSIGAAVLCLPWLRWKQPDLERPIKVNLLFPLFYLLATLFVVIVPMVASPVETGYGCLMILSSIPVYAVFVAWKSKPKWFNTSLSMLFMNKLFIADNNLTVFLVLLNFLRKMHKKCFLNLISGVMTAFLQKLLMVLGKSNKPAQV